ncbi:MAG: polysaccharide biosynthesis/export family protein [Prevotella sp.]|nr:polysaccharide biosynthesis/export family protein [Prevotella sp.]
MKKILLFFGVLACAFMFTGCTLTKHLVYFKNIDTVNLAKGEMRPKIKIKPNDELTINVTSVTPEAAAPFNFNATSVNGGSYAGTAGSIYTYIVDKDGMINFPVLGKIKVQGKTRPELEDYLTEQIQPYFTENEKPVVKVRISNFKVTVIGAIGTNVITVDNERMSIIECIARCGDLNIYGKRPNILLIRENEKGEKITARFNINDANILNSPYYFLEQNDIIYVEPHKIQARSADLNANLFWTQIVSATVSLAAMVIAITKW